MTVRLDTYRRSGNGVGLPELSVRNVLGIVWIVNFEAIIVDWEIAQRRVALGERATLTGAGNKVGSKRSAWSQKMAHGTRRSSRSNPLKEVLIPSQDGHRATGCYQCIRKRKTISELAHSLSIVILPLGGFTDAFRFE